MTLSSVGMAGRVFPMLTPPSSISPKRQRNELLQNSLCAVIVSAGRSVTPPSSQT